MLRKSSIKLVLTVALSALLLLVVVVCIFQVLGFRHVRPQTQHDAASSVAGALAPPLEAKAGDLSDAELASFDAAAAGLLSDEVRAIRLWSVDGELLGAAGTAQTGTANAAALAKAAGGDTAALRTISPEGDVLAGYTPFAEGAVLEIQQDYAPVAEAIAARNASLLLVAVALCGLVVLGLPLTAWLTLRIVKTDYNRLLYLYRTGQAMRSSLDLTDVLEQLAREAAVYIRADLGVVTLVDEKDEELVVMASYDSDAGTSAQHHRKVEEWYLRRCAATGRTVVTELEAPPHAALLGHDPPSEGPVIAVCVPIPGRERTTGIVTVVRRKAAGSMEATEVRAVEEMAGHGAIAVEQTGLFAKMRHYADEVELSYDTTLKALMAALDAKDSTTHGHSERVTRLTLALAREMGVPNERLVDIERGALLHDVGKIGVPDAILRKPSTLNDKEWEAVQKHPLLAGMMLSKIGVLEGALPILLYHHERYDGNGYPFGLAGKAIPLEARIFAVVDAFDAMTSERPYRQAMPAEAAMEEIHKHTGTQFDPQVVEAFDQVIGRRTRPRKQAA